MRFDPEKHHRRSIRLKGYDYGRPGSYFITICVRDRECWFGEIRGDEVRLNDAGRVVAATWMDLPSRFPGVSTDTHVVMPNHLHGIVHITGQGAMGTGATQRGAINRAPTVGHAAYDRYDVRTDIPNHGDAHLGDDAAGMGGTGMGAINRAPTVGNAVPVGAQFIAPYAGHDRYDGQTGAAGTGTATLGRIVRAFKAVTTRIVRQTGMPHFAWQRNYYEHIVRDELALDRVRQYILDNPARWASDRENPWACCHGPDDA